MKIHARPIRIAASAASRERASGRVVNVMANNATPRCFRSRFGGPSLTGLGALRWILLADRWGHRLTHATHRAAERDRSTGPTEPRNDVRALHSARQRGDARADPYRFESCPLWGTPLAPKADPTR